MDDDDLLIMDEYVEIKKDNKLKEIQKNAYTQNRDFEFYDALLEYSNIEPKNEYLLLLNYFYSLINLKLKIKEEMLVSNTILIPKDNYKINITLDKIRLQMEKNNLKVEDKKDPILYHIYDFIKEEFEKLNINIETINFLLNLTENNLIENKLYSYRHIKNSKAVLIYLFKSFYDSGKFKKLVDNLSSIKKKIFVLKFEEFDIDKYFDNNEYVRGVFDLYKHKDDSFDGYELRRLFQKLEDDKVFFNSVSINV